MHIGLPIAASSVFQGRVVDLAFLVEQIGCKRRRIEPRVTGSSFRPSRQSLWADAVELAIVANDRFGELIVLARVRPVVVAPHLQHDLECFLKSFESLALLLRWPRPTALRQETCIDIRHYCGIPFCRRVALCAITVVLVAGCSTAAISKAPVPPPGPPDNLWEQAEKVVPNEPWVVGIGDSYMSGEGGAWASNGPENAVAPAYGGWLLGSPEQVYGDGTEGAEEIPGCHRTATAPMFVGKGYNIKNLACSGAKVNSYVATFGDLNRLKPGIDFVDTPTIYGQATGQALQLQRFAQGKDVKVVVMSIIGNDVGFVDILSDCVVAFLTPGGTSNPCGKGAPVSALINPVARARLIPLVATAVQNVNTAMTNAGKSPGDWRLIYDMPPSPLPESSNIQFGEGYDRQVEGGCGMLNEDLDWANNELIPWIYSVIADGVKLAQQQNKQLVPVTLLDNRNTVAGHQLCEIGTTRPPASTGIPPNEFGNNVEWFRNLSLYLQTKQPSSVAATEAFHPNYFGQRAIASCVRGIIDFPGSPRAAMACAPKGATTYDSQTPPLITSLKVSPIAPVFTGKSNA